MTVQSYIASQDQPAKEILTVLRSWILDLGRHVEEKMSTTGPSFYLFGALCTLSSHRDGGVELCFGKGNILDDENKILESRGRKEARSKTFFSVAELEEAEDPIRHLLNEAAILNEYHYKQRQKKKKAK